MTNSTKKPNRIRLIILGISALILAFAAGEMVLNKMGLSLLPVPPEAINAGDQKDEGPVTASRHMVTAAHPLASQAGLEILRAGGNAIDAAIAVETVLTLVEPQSSGIGGGAFMLFWNGPQKTLTSYDGREKAPQRADQSLFLNDAGEPMSFFEALVGGRAVGAPGTIAHVVESPSKPRPFALGKAV